MLTATTLCRSALILLEEGRDAEPREVPWPVGAERFTGIKGLFGAFLWVSDEELQLTLDAFVKARIIPMMDAWEQDFLKADLSPEYLILPKGFMDAKNERYNGVAMRCLFEENRPTKGHDVPSRVATYYDVSMDEFKEEPCSACISFWVHTPNAVVKLDADQ